MAEVLAVHLDGMEGSEWLAALGWVSPYKQDRIRRFANPIDAKRCLVGDLLVRFALGERLACPTSAIDIDVSDDGKPFVRNASHGVHFNLSHSGSWIVCAVDEGPIGVDIEYIRPIAPGVGRWALSLKEYDMLQQKPPEARTPFFFTLWTLKESFLKATGTGLGRPLNSFSVLEAEPGHFRVQGETTSPHQFWTHAFHKEYKLAACLQGPFAIDGVRLLHWRDLFDFFRLEDIDHGSRSRPRM